MRKERRNYSDFGQGFEVVQRSKGRKHRPRIGVVYAKGLTAVPKSTTRTLLVRFVFDGKSTDLFETLASTNGTNIGKADS